jgi:osmotically-inducible protein OsmY
MAGPEQTAHETTRKGGGSMKEGLSRLESVELTKYLLCFTVALFLLLLPGVDARGQSAEADTDIATAVSLQLLFDQGVPSHLIDVESVEGIVTLSGTVSNVMARERAARVATTVRGVRSVVNEIDVKTDERPDEALANDVERAFVMNPVTESWEIDADVEDGRVTLTGMVESWQEKQLAARVARSVNGVAEVDNRIGVTFEQDRPDAEIKEEIEAALSWDICVDDALIDVMVDDGEVTLSGTVGSAAEKNRALADAWVAGVESVDTERLEVAEWARSEKLRAGKYVMKEDDEITEAVEDALLYDPRVNMFDVDVSSDEGIVTLSGTVRTLEARRAAAQDARNTVGVWRVRNLVAVRPPNIRPDEAIAEDVRRAIDVDPFLDRYEIDVEVENGLVILDGNVQTWFEKGEAENVASRVAGVVDVENDILVFDPTPLSDSPYIDEWYLTDFDRHPERARYTAMPDWEIEQNIEDELWWSPFVDSGDVTVDVEDGVAKLTGTVDTMAERDAAESNAYQGGAVYVDNDLLVDFGPPYYP